MKKISMNEGKFLNRAELKSIKGFGGFTPPAPPNGNPVGSYKCCLTAAPAICSVCVLVPTNAVCQPGAVLTAC